MKRLDVVILADSLSPGLGYVNGRAFGWFWALAVKLHQLMPNGAESGCPHWTWPKQVSPLF